MVTRNDLAMEITYGEFNDVINNTPQIVVVNFFAEWCMPCLMLSPVIEDLAKELSGIKFVKINIDDNEELADNHNISTIPCLIIFKKGKEIDRLVGARTYEAIEERLRKHIFCNKAG
jgi:thioredoxin 1